MADRCYPVPITFQFGVLGSAATLDRIDLAATLGNGWAARLRAKENAQTLERVLEGDVRLPRGATDGDEFVLGLVRDGHAWTRHGWEPAPTPPGTCDLDADDVAFVARAVLAGSPVRLVPYTPVAVIRREWASNGGMTAADTPVSPGGGAALPPGTKVIAVVDEYDRDAVLDTVAVLPGPKIKRRHDGQWMDDPGWVSVLRSVRPPPVVVLSAAQIPDVLSQIDQATAGEPFQPTKPQARRASAYTDRADDMIIEWSLSGLLAVGDGRMPGKLARYWRFGPGAAKIRWGTPGAWTRCHRNLSKYIGPERARGACTNLAKPLGGHGVATHVGD
ncbi:MAG TPA: hypothetical protein VH482_05225 [Thermomicrobiales bacterium]|jgi:hypothetical protein